MKNIVGISNLEAEILLIVWDKGTTTNREVYEAFIKKDVRDKKSGFIPYTNILSTMNGLARKKILKVDKSRKTYIYSAAARREEIITSIVKSVEESLL